ncbi:sigma-70 family RNA polymerase sigma factor [Dactylosporangium sp. AC04546]|uniref:RNA polymerase sigma factor n=1 Tax=Dactylosporangium sp. AC04546 TaxID=2862460 RepID=UPI001EE0EEF8|nr:sigma-70 family RNA polymerase sigma factor [Dactylosporangium sp. AC04546]WVK87015.1 sigma-70 family RNA polymerase sigma factor [Dactylosporangium sp. AC04546]
MWDGDSNPRSASSTADQPDDELVSRAAAGDRRAFDALARRHQARMHAICRRVTANEHDALDALQNALTTAWQRISTFDGRSQIGTWFYRVATNAAIDEVRRRRRRPDLVDDLPAVPAPMAAVEDAVTDRLAVIRAMSQLPVQFRNAVALREFWGFSYREIAEILDVPIDTVKSQISRGRQGLVALLSASNAA